MPGTQKTLLLILDALLQLLHQCLALLLQTLKIAVVSIRFGLGGRSCGEHK